MKINKIIGIVLLFLLSLYVANAALTDDDQVYLKFDVDNVTQPDATGNGRTGIVDSATFNSSGKINGAYNFDGINDDIIVGNTTDFGYNIGSISFWIYPKDISGGYITQRRVGATGDRSFLLIFSSSNLVFQLKNTADSTLSAITSTSNMKLSEWQFVTATWNGTHAALYINGILNGTDTQSGTVSPTNLPTYVGSRSGDLFYEGLIDEFSIWNRSLSQSEVTDLYGSGSGNQYPFGAADSCTPPAINNNWIIDSTDDCNIIDQEIDLGTGGIYYTGIGSITFNNVNLTSSFFERQTGDGGTDTQVYLYDAICTII